MDSSVKLDGEHDEQFTNVSWYWSLVEKLIYLSVTHPNIIYVVSVASQFMHAPCQPHFEAVCQILHYFKGAPGHGLLYKPSTFYFVTSFCDAI